MKSFVMALSMAVVLLASSSAMAQRVVAYMPVGPAPVAAYYAPQPVVAGPVFTGAYYAPQPYYFASPAAYYAAAPAPVVTAYYGGPVYAGPVVAPYYYGRAVVVRPKVYVVGQPVRNVLRAVTP